MDKPIRTGFFFGIGFSLVFILLTVGLGLVYEYVVESFVDKLTGASAEEAAWPEVVYTKAERRGQQMVVLASVRNSSASEAHFQAEALLLDANGELVDSCSIEREFALPAGDTMDIKADCPSYDDDSDSVFSRVASAKLQFFESDYY